jgi:hypothetical protein
MARNSNVIRFKRGQHPKVIALITKIEERPLWGREVNLFKKLMEKYPFDHLMLITRKVDSLLWFFTADGEKYLTNLKYNVLYKPEEKKPPIILSDHNVGESITTKPRLKIKDFLK